MNVMDNMRGTQDMALLGESSVSKASTEPLEYVVAGAQMLTIKYQVAAASGVPKPASRGFERNRLVTSVTRMPVDYRLYSIFG